MKRLLFRLGGLALISGWAAGQTTATVLHNRYAVPHREEMQARPGISITVQYGLDLQACEIRIHPMNASLLRKEPETLMIPDTVTELVNELIPLSERGNPGMSTITSSGCNKLTTQEYEHVTIIRGSHDCLPLQSAREFPATLLFKKTECASVEKARQVR